MKQLIVCLGAEDVEMAEIEQSVVASGHRVCHAMAGGKRCHPGNAYVADDCSDGVAWGAVDVLVECDGISEAIIRDHVVRIDHHRPGDVGYWRPPEEYLQASSIGQVLALLGVEPTQHHRIVAAADHCLAAAYRGQCPGVDADELMVWRAEVRAAHQGRSVASVLQDVEAARKILLDNARWRHIEGYPGADMFCPNCQTADHPDCMHPGQDHYYADLRDHGHIPELPEAACRQGIPFLQHVDDRDGRRKVVLQAADSSLVEAFLGGHIVLGLHDYYGDPARGFAGGYLSFKTA